jgi:hypothetical protein
MNYDHVRASLYALVKSALIILVLVLSVKFAQGHYEDIIGLVLSIVLFNILCKAEQTGDFYF